MAEDFDEFVEQRDAAAQAARAELFAQVVAGRTDAEIQQLVQEAGGPEIGLDEIADARTGGWLDYAFAGPLALGLKVPLYDVVDFSPGYGGVDTILDGMNQAIWDIIRSRRSQGD